MVAKCTECVYLIPKISEDKLGSSNSTVESMRFFRAIFDGIIGVFLVYFWFTFGIF